MAPTPDIEVEGPPTISLVFTLEQVASLACGTVTRDLKGYFLDAAEILRAAVKQAALIAAKKKRRGTKA